MSNLKKALAVLTVFVMVFALAVTGFASSVYTDQESIGKDYEKAVALLDAYGIMRGDASSGELHFYPQQVLIRDQICKMAYVIVNYGADDKAANFQSAVVFADVTADRWSAGYVNALYSMGIIAGTGADAEGKALFSPNKQLTGYETMKIFLGVLGYSDAIEGYQGANWELRVLGAAQNAGLLKGFKGVQNWGDGITREKAALMMANALSATVVTYNSASKRIEEMLDVLSSTKLSLGAKYFDATQYSGSLVSNPSVSLDASAPATKDVAFLFDGESYYKLAITDEMNLLQNLGKPFSGTAKLAGDGSKADPYTVVAEYSAPVVGSGTTLLIESSAFTVAKATTPTDDWEANAAAKFFINYAEVNPSAIAALPAGNKVLYVDYDADDKADYVLATNYSYAKVTDLSTDGLSVKATLGDGTAAALNNVKLEKIIGGDKLEKGDRILYASYATGKYFFEKVGKVTAKITKQVGGSAVISGGTYSEAGIPGSLSNFATIIATSSNFTAANDYYVYGDYVLEYVSLNDDPVVELNYCFVTASIYDYNTTTKTKAYYVWAVKDDGTAPKLYTLAKYNGDDPKDTIADDALESFDGSTGNILYSYTLSEDGKSISLTSQDAEDYDNGTLADAYAKGGKTFAGLAVDSKSEFFLFKHDDDGEIAAVKHVTGRANVPAIAEDSPYVVSVTTDGPLGVETVATAFVFDDNAVSPVVEDKIVGIVITAPATVYSAEAEGLVVTMTISDGTEKTVTFATAAKSEGIEEGDFVVLTIKDDLVTNVSGCKDPVGARTASSWYAEDIVGSDDGVVTFVSYTSYDPDYTSNGEIIADVASDVKVFIRNDDGTFTEGTAADIKAYGYFTLDDDGEPTDERSGLYTYVHYNADGAVDTVYVVVPLA